MYHPSSGRNGFNTLCLDYAISSIKIKHGPNENDEFEMNIDSDETKESLLEKIASITKLQKQINELQKGNRKRKTRDAEEMGSILGSESNIVSMLHRENELRTSEAVQERFA